MNSKERHSSRKKPKKSRNSSKKPRKQVVNAYFDMQEEGTYTFCINADEGLVLYGPDKQKVAIKQIDSQLYYDRESKRKVVAYTESSCPPFLNHSLTLRNYNYLCAVDTNTRKIHGRTISIAFVFLGLWDNTGEYTKFSFYPEIYIDFMDFDGKPERYAWYKTIELITKGHNYDDHNTFGIIVDSDLGEIPAINSRNEPIYDQYYLPNKMELIYASGDKSDTVQNIMIKKCDQFATDRLNRFEEVYKSKESLDIFPENYTNIARVSMPISE